MAEWVWRQYGERVEFELSIDNVEKPPLSDREIAKRLAAFGPQQPVWLTRAATFVEKANLFPRVTFLVGADTVLRVADPRFYPNGKSGVEGAIERFCQAECRFLVFGRLVADSFHTLIELPLPAALRARCQAVPATEFREDISSTQLRTDR